MSKFSTRLPVNVEELFDALPKGYYVHSVTYHKDTKELVIEWEHEKLSTGLSIPVDFPLADIQRKRLPELCRAKKAPKSPPKEETAPVSLPEPEKAIPASTPTQQWTKEQFEAAQAEGAVLECQGVEPVWVKVLPGHQHQQGFFYRKVEVRQDPHSIGGPTIIGHLKDPVIPIVVKREKSVDSPVTVK